MDWILGNLPSIIIGGILMIIVVMIIMSKIKERKHGGCGCGCPGCTGSCPHSSVSDIEQKDTSRTWRGTSHSETASVTK